MAIEMIAGRLCFDAILQCTWEGCAHYREPPQETVEKGRAFVDKNWRDQEFLAFRCLGCGRVRYVDECMKIERIRNATEPQVMVSQIPPHGWGDDDGKS